MERKLKRYKEKKFQQHANNNSDVK
jgi:hypothetical protein